MNKQLLLVVGAVVLSFALGVGAGFGGDRYLVYRGVPPTEPNDAKATFGVFWEAWQLVEQKYVDQSVVTPTNLTHGAISGMLDALGDTGHTRFLSPSDRKAEDDSLAGKLEGIGIEVEVREGHVTVVAPFDGSPAQKAGIRPGDVIEKINGQDATRMNLDQVSTLIRGPKGTTVHLTMLRPGAAELLDFTIVRDELTVPDVTWAMVPGTTIAHIRISGFGQNVDSELRQALHDATDQHATKVILDLRNDPGGLLDQAIKVASEFLSSGNVLLVQDRSGQRTPDAVQSGGQARQIPMDVLVNHGTASAAEIVAGALQDQHRGLVIGEQTFGTGTVLNEFPLSDGSALLIGTSEWLTPDGHSIRNNGITPDDVVAEPVSATLLVPEAEKTLSPDQLQKSDDKQLLEAVGKLS
jgi:carboxyl-terminal processing protease